MDVDDTADVDDRCVPVSELMQRRGKVAHVRHGCAVHEQRDHGIIAAQGGEHFDMHWVACLLDAATLRVGTKPSWSDDHENDVALLEDAIDILSEVDAEADGVDTHEDILVTEVCSAPVKDPHADAS